jgi:hypothetical protein
MICGAASGAYNVPIYSVLIIVVCANVDEVSSTMPIDVITLSILCILMIYSFLLERSRKYCTVAPFGSARTALPTLRIAILN